MSNRIKFSVMYPARLEEFETGRRLGSEALLARCDGISAGSDLAEFIDDHELPRGLRIRRVMATLRFHPADSSLFMELEFEANKKPLTGDMSTVSAVMTSILEHWDHEFELPDELSDYQVHFETKPATKIDDPLADEVLAVVAEWPTASFNRIAALSDSELDALTRRLGPLEKRVCKNSAVGDEAKVRDLIVACRAHTQRRALSRLPPDPEAL